MDSLQGQINFDKIDVDTNRDLSTKYGVRSVPLLVLVEGENEINRIVGVQTREQILNFYNG
jgi:thioredoxin-like negative regulator of GroEL